MNEKRDVVGKHIVIRWHDLAGGPTDYCTVEARRGGLLGWIRWYWPWRCWILKPCEGTIWSADCLDDVGRFLKSQGAAR